MELELIKLLSTKDNYNKYSNLIVVDRLSSDVRTVIQNLDLYYSETGNDVVDWDEYYTWYTGVKHPSMSAANALLLYELTKKVADAALVVSSVVLKNFVIRDYASQLGDMAYELVDGTGKYSIDDADDLVMACKRELLTIDGVTSDKHISSGDLKDRLTELKHGTVYNWRLNELQKSLGPIKQGDFIIIGARPDSGKTTFLASEATFFAAQLKDDECVLWFNNEEAVERIRNRQCQAALNWTQDEVLKDLDATVDAYAKAIGGMERLVVFDKSDMSVTDIDRALTRYNAKIIVIDQIWKLRGFEKHSTSDIDRYAQIAAYLRDIAKKHGAVLTTSQIDAQAEGVRYPDMGRLYNSKTSVQGEADAIIMIGRDHTEPQNVRFIHAPKNKLSLGESKYRNAGWAVGIDQDHARFISKIGRP